MVAVQPPPDGKFSKILVPTVDTVRSTWLLDIMVQVSAGSHGTDILGCLFSSSDA